MKDGEGNLSDEVRNKVLDALGFGTFENARDVSKLHIRKAERENVTLLTQDAEVDGYDDHALHIAEHTRTLLSGGEDSPEVKNRFMRHLEEHRRKGGK